MYRNNRLFWLIYLIQDIYWCFIPLNCRRCLYLRQCRFGVSKKRKCINGCVKLKLSAERKRKLSEEERINSLLEYIEGVEYFEKRTNNKKSYDKEF